MSNKEELSKKAERMRQYRKDHPEQMRAYRKAYYKKNKAKIAAQRKAFYERDKAKIQERSRKYYQENREARDKYANAYKDAHKPQINEHSRQNYYKRLGRPIKNKPYSFYRDFIKQIKNVKGCTNRVNVYRLLLAMPLTDHQKNLIRMTRDGKSQVEIAKKLNITQCSICKAWNGSQRSDKKYFGGIYNKLLKLVLKNEEVRAFLESLNLKWRKVNNGKRIKKRKISIHDSRSSVLRTRME
jgi:hypothetical protein